MVERSRAPSSKDHAARHCKRFNVSRSVVSDIATGRVHKDVTVARRRAADAKARRWSAKGVPDYDPTDKRIMNWRPRSSTDRRAQPRAAKSQAGAKIAGLFKAITAEMDQRIKPFASLPAAFEYRRKAQITEHCVMHLSDGHHDQVVVPDQGGRLGRVQLPDQLRPRRAVCQHGCGMDPGHLGPEVLFSGLVGPGLR